MPPTQSAASTPVAAVAEPTKDSAAPQTGVTLPDELCSAQLSAEQVRFLVEEKLDDTAAVAAIRDCHGSVMAHSTPAMQDVIHVGPRTNAPFFGYGLEALARQDCLADGSELGTYLDSMGICNRHLQEALVLLCFQAVSHGDPCNIVQLAVDVHLSDVRSEWASIGHDEIPEAYVRDRHGQGVKREQAGVLPVLDYLADQYPERGGFDPNQSRPYDGEKMKGFLWPSRVTFTDVNGPSEVHLTPAQIARQLEARQGPAFRALAHVGSIYALPYLQYSMIWFDEHSAGRLVVYIGWRFDGLASHYRLTFGDIDGEWKLGRVDYRNLEGQVPPWVIEHWEKHGYPPGMKPPDAPP